MGRTIFLELAFEGLSTSQCSAILDANQGARDEPFAWRQDALSHKADHNPAVQYA